MLCEKCGQQDASVKFVQIENNKRTEHYLCKNCAQGQTNFTLGLDLQQLLSTMFQPGTLTPKVDQSQSKKQCDTCGRTLFDIQKNGRLGCGTCYDVFQGELHSVLRKIHGSNSHSGKVPVRALPQVHLGRLIEETRQKLEESVRLEKYENAAKYRDEIRLLEARLQGKDGENVGE